MSKKHTQTLVFCHKRQKMVPKGEQYDSLGNRPQGPLIIPPLKPFVSSVTGELISSREQLARHNRIHGVTDMRDYSPEYMEKRQAERYQRLTGDTPADRADRIERIKRALYRS